MVVALSEVHSRAAESHNRSLGTHCTHPEVAIIMVTSVLRLLWSQNGRGIPVVHPLSISVLYFPYSIN